MARRVRPDRGSGTLVSTAETAQVSTHQGSRTHGVYSLIATDRAKAPDLAQQLLLREDAARLGGELQQQLVLLRRQVDPLAADRDAAGRPVDLERADAHEVRDDRRRPPQDGPDAGQQ